MRGQTFAARQDRGGLAEFAGAFRRAVDQAGALLKVVDAERRGKARGAGGRQYVVRAGAVVAQGFGSMAAEENRAGVADVFAQGFRLGDRQFQMFRRDPVRDFGGLPQVFDPDQAAAPRQGCLDDLGTFHLRQ